MIVASAQPVIAETGHKPSLATCTQQPPWMHLMQVDNNPFSFLANPANGLPVAPFAGDPHDDHLLASVRASASPHLNTCVMPHHKLL